MKQRRLRMAGQWSVRAVRSAVQHGLAAVCRLLCGYTESLTISNLRSRVNELDLTNRAHREQCDLLASKVALLEAEKDGLALLNEANLQRVRALIAECGGDVGKRRSTHEASAGR